MIDSKQITPNYCPVLNLGFTIAKFNFIGVDNDEIQLMRFKKSAELVWTVLKTIFENHVVAFIQYKKSFEVFMESMQSIREHDINGQILVIKKPCYNWRKCLTDYERKNPTRQKIYFVIIPEKNNWRISAIGHRRFQYRKKLLSFDEMIKKITKPSEVKFIHTQLFIGISTTLETCIEMGKLSL